MKPRRYTYASECDKEQLTPDEEYACKFHRYNRLKLKTIPISPKELSFDDTEYLHAVEAIKIDKYSIRIRVITNTYRGVNITIPYISETLYHKYLDLRFQIRNTDKVLITFPEIYITGSSRQGELFLLAYDFKLYNPNENKPAQPTLLI